MNQFAVFFVCFMLSASSLFSQLMPYTQYTVKDGLPSSNIYCIAQDSLGFIWMGTDNGLCRFDGYEFRTVKNSIDREEITSLSISDSQIIHGSYKKQIVFSNYYGEKSFSLKSSNLYSYDQIVEKDDLIIVLNKGYNVLIKNKNSIIYNSYFTSKDSSNYPISISSFGQCIYIGGTKGISKIELDHNNLIKTNLEKSDAKITSLACESDSIIYYSKNDSIFKFNHRLGSTILLYAFDLENFSIKQLKLKGNVLYVLSHFPTRLFKLSLGNEAIPETIKLESNYYINNFFVDSNGSIWLGTKQNGLIRINDPIFFRYLKIDSKSLSINKIVKSMSNSVMLATSHGLYSIFNNRVNSISINKSLQQYLRSISYAKDSIIISVVDPVLTGGTSKFQSFSTGQYNLLFIPSSCAIKHNSDTLIVGNWQSEINYVKLNHLTKEFHKLNTVKLSHHQRNRITDIKSLNSDLIVSSESGIYRVSDMNKIYKLSDRKALELKYLNDTSVIGICNKHLLWISPLYSTEVPIANYLGSLDLSLNSFCYYDNELWFGTNKGIYIYNGLTSSFIKIGHEYGLPTENINYLMYDSIQRQIITAADSYVLFIDPNQIALNSKKIAVTFVNLYSEHRSVNNPTSLTLRSHDRKFKIKYVAFNLTNPFAVTYRYMIDNNKWVTTKSRELEFNELGYGSHEFRISASVYGGEWGPSSTINFYIKPPFWQTSYFYIVCSLLVIGGVYHTSKRRYNKLKYSSGSRLTSHYQLESMKQKINAENLSPHFIYNALNSIKDFLKTKQLSLSFGYIDKFSKLIRINIASSTNPTVRLVDELYRVRYYLDLEKLRVKIPFEYEINISENIDLRTTWMPNMIIQPLVENIIWHGFLEPVKKGLIQINLKKRFSGIELSVIDNGIGIKESKKRENKSHKSQGTELILAQLMTIDPFTTSPITISEARKGHDLPGTKVVIRLTTKMVSEPK